MIDEVMKEIAEAERQAEEITAKGAEDARAVLLGAQNEVEQMKKEFALRLKERQTEIMRQAEQQAQQQAAQLLKEAKVRAAETAKVGERTFSKCVESIAEKIAKA